MSASSDLRPAARSEPSTVSDDTNPPQFHGDQTVPNGGAVPLVARLAPRTVSFQPSHYPGDLGRLARYRVLKQLGQGGMGAVYLGFDERLRRKVALKVMLPDSAEEPQAKERFLREARAAAQIAHDHVIAIHEADEADGIPYIAMQYLQGYPLDEYLAKKGRPSFPQIVRIGREVALGLAAAHRLGLVHRDIKPGNIWLEAPQGRVKILDFGLARPAKHNEGELTQSGMVVGTPAYMAPEQARGLPVDGRADLFSLGVLLYRLVTNALPFDGPDVMAMLTALAVEDPKPVLEWNPATPKPLAELIHELLAKKPGKRPQSADEVAARLQAIADRNSGAVGMSNQVVYVPVPVTVVESGNAFEGIIDETIAAETTQPESRRNPASPTRRPYGLIVAGVAAMTAGIGLLAILLASPRKPEPKPVDEKVAKKPTESSRPLKKLEPTSTLDSTPFPRLDPAWVKAASAVPASELLTFVSAELKRRNPDYDGNGLTWVHDPLTNIKTALELRSDRTTDLTPLLVVPNLETLFLLNAGKEPSQLVSLAPLRGMKKLRYLQLDGHARLMDLSPLQGLPIEQLVIRHCAVESLEALKGLPLERLEIPSLFVQDFHPLAKLPLRSFTFGHHNLATDLSPLAECPLEHVRIEWGIGMDLTPLRKHKLKSFTMVNTAQPDLKPLEGSSIEDFSGFDPIQYESFLRTLPKLQTVGAYNSKPVPAEEYFRTCERLRAERDAYVDAMRKLPTIERIPAIRKRFEEQNAGKLSVFEVTIENAEVVEVNYTGSDASSSCWDLSYLRAFPKLRKVIWKDIHYAPMFHQIVDLPIEEVEIPDTSIHLASNLYAFAKMKSLKVVNGLPIEQFSEVWKLRPTKAAN